MARKLTFYYIRCCNYNFQIYLIFYLKIIATANKFNIIKNLLKCKIHFSNVIKKVFIEKFEKSVCCRFSF